MAYNPNAPANDEFLADFPPEMREQLRAIINDKIVNAQKINGLSAGNANGNVPISNGTKNVNLNADLLDGKDSTDFATATHTHSVATANDNGFMSNTDKSKLNGIESGAEVNQNAFANVKVGSTTIQADAKQDTLELAAGTNITLTPDATNDKVTVAAPNVLPLAGGSMTGVINSNTNSNVDATGETRYEETLSVGRDKNNLGLGADYYSAYNVDVFHGIRASNPNITGGNWADIRLHVNADKKRWISADWHSNLTDGTTDNSNNIPTTAFIHSKYLSLAGGTMTGTITTSAFDFIRRNVNNSYIMFLGGTGFLNSASLILEGGNSSNGGAFELLAQNGTTSKLFTGKPDGTLTWNGAGLGGTHLGDASTGVATNLTLPKSGTYLVITGHNSTAGSNSIWIVRTGGNNAFKMAGGSNITMTCSETTITVTSSGGSVGVYYIHLG